METITTEKNREIKSKKSFLIKINSHIQTVTVPNSFVFDEFDKQANVEYPNAAFSSNANVLYLLYYIFWWGGVGREGRNYTSNAFYIS